MKSDLALFRGGKLKAMKQEKLLRQIQDGITSIIQKEPNRRLIINQDNDGMIYITTDNYTMSDARTIWDGEGYHEYLCVADTRNDYKTFKIPVIIGLPTEMLIFTMFQNIRDV